MIKTSHFNAPIHEAVKRIVEGSYLMNKSYQFRPWYNIRELKSDDDYPVVIVHDAPYSVTDDSCRAINEVTIIILDIFPELAKCDNEGDKYLLARQAVHYYQQSLLEISDLLGNVHQDRIIFDKEDYCWRNDRLFDAFYGERLFTYFGLTKAEREDHPLKDQLFGTLVTGRLEGILKFVCCNVSPFEVTPDEECPDC